MTEQPDWFGNPFSEDELKTFAAPDTQLDHFTRQKLVQEIRVLRWIGKSLARFIDDSDQPEIEELRQSEVMKLVRFLLEGR